jgi:hypothetical protein
MRRKWQGGNGYWDVPNEEAEMGSARMEMSTVARALYGGRGWAWPGSETTRTHHRPTTILLKSRTYITSDESHHTIDFFTSTDMFNMGS